MKRVMNYIAILTSILCLQESYAVASRLAVDCSSQTTNISLLSAPTTLSSYPALKANITTSSSLLQSVEGTTTLQSKLQASGGYIMSKLNGERAAVLVDYAKFFKANTGKENAFKNDNYAFDAWWIGAKSSAGTTTELTDADMSPGLVGVDGGSKELLYAKKVIAPANTLDMIIHANGSSYKFEINGSYIEGDHRVLAGWLKSQGYNTQTIRLLSCSELSSAQNLSNKLNQPVIATDGYVCIYSDGGLSVVPRNGNGDTKWYLLKPGNIRNEMVSPRAPGSAGLDYVQMGGASLTTYQISLGNILANSKFSGSSGLFNKSNALPTTARRTRVYANLNTFRDEFIKLHTDNGSVGIQSLQTIIQHFGNLVTKYGDKSNMNVEAYIDELMQGKTKFKGGAFGMEVLAGPLINKTVVSFEAKIDEDADSESNCRFDIHYMDGSSDIFLETKNHASSTTFSTSFYNQFLAYIKDARDIDQIKYYFRSNSGIDKLTQVQKFIKIVNTGSNKTALYNNMNPAIKTDLIITSEASINNALLTNMFNSIIEVY